MIFQEPTTSLNPCFTIGFQLAETLRLHLDLDRRAARGRAVELLEQVGIPAAASRLSDFPHQMSGGMNQRVMIAMAIACNPRLLIADEPTTALDVTIQAQILDLLRDLQRERGMALVLVTHNMGVVAEMARRVAVMYAGQVMEERARRRRSSPRPSIRTPRRCSRRCPSGTRAAGGSRRFPAWCRACYDRPAGCLFAPRCAYATRALRASGPPLRPWQRRAASAATIRSASRTASRDRPRRRTPAVERADRRRSGERMSGKGSPASPVAPATSTRARAADAVVARARDVTRVYEVRRGAFREPAHLTAVGGLSFERRRRAARSRSSANRGAASPRSRAWSR